MATSQRRPAPSVKTSIATALFEEAYAFDFHKAVMILEALEPACMPLGEGGSPKKEAFRLSSEILLSPPSSDLHHISMANNGGNDQQKPIIHINFMGLAGIQGPLPMPFTERVLERLRAKDTATKDYLDIFNHRLASLWHRLKKKVIIGVSQIPAEETPAGKVFLDLLGMAPKTLRGLLAISDRILMNYAGLFWQRPRSIIGLERLLRQQFQAPITISQFQGKWRYAPLKDCTVIGRKVVGGRFQSLGESAILGQRSWDQSAGILVTIPMIGYPMFLCFLSKNGLNGLGDHNKILRDICFFYMGPLKSLAVKIFVNPVEIPPLCLNGAFILGKNTWLTRGQGKGFLTPPSVCFEAKAL